MAEIAILFFLAWLFMLLTIAIMYIVKFVKKLFKSEKSVMTEKQIKEGKRYLSIIGQLDDAIERFKYVKSNGISLHLPNDDDVLSSIKELLVAKRDKFKKEFEEL